MDRSVRVFIGGSAERRRNRQHFLNFADVDRGFLRQEHRKEHDPVGRVEHLNRFKQHFDDMLVCVPSGGFARFAVENEDVHVWSVALF